MLVPFGPVCQRCESTDADSLKAIVQQQQDDALLNLVGLCRVWRVTQSSRGCASWLGVRALSSSPTPLARYRICVQVWRRCLILGEVSVQCSRWLSIAKRGCAFSRTEPLPCSADMLQWIQHLMMVQGRLDFSSHSRRHLLRPSLTPQPGHGLDLIGAGSGASHDQSTLPDMWCIAARSGGTPP